MSFSHALKWSFLSEASVRLVQPIVFIVLAQFVTPEDFGVITAALMVVAFSQIFWEAGMSKALIQCQENVDEAADAAFWLNVGLGFVIGGALYLSSQSIAQAFFQDDRVALVLQAMTLQVLLGAISSVHIALLQKDMDFKQLFWIRLTTTGLPGIASIPLAWSGLGYWALVAGTLIGQAGQAALLWKLSRWRPRLAIRRTVAKDMAQFGAWVSASGLLGWFYVWADALIVGMYLGSHDMGLYRTGNQLATMLYALVFGPIAPVLYSHLSRMNRDTSALRRAAEKVIRTLTLIALPAAALCFALSDHIEEVFFDADWVGIGSVFGIMALMHGISWIVGMNGEIYRAMGKPAYETIVTAGSLVVYLAAYMVSITYGLQAFLWTRCLLAVGALALHLGVIRYALGLGLLPSVAFIGLVGCICGSTMLVVGQFLMPLASDDWVQLAIGSVTGAVAMAGILLIIDRGGIARDLLSVVRGRP